MAENFSHEIVIPTDPLFAWVHIFKDLTGPSTIAPHWHEGIELSYTIRGQIDEFKINGKKFQTQPGQILVKNVRVTRLLVEVLELLLTLKRGAKRSTSAKTS